MRKIFTSSLFVAFGAALILNTNKVSSNASQPRAGYAGDPNGSTCNSCHNGSPSADATQFTLHMTTNSALLTDASTLVTPTTTFNPDSTYFVSLTLKSATTRNGFELAAYQGSAQGGTLIRTNTTNTSLSSLGGISYLGHKNASATSSWSFQWKAPSTTSAVTMYFAGMNANGNGNEGGDLVYTSSVILNGVTPTNGIAAVQNLNQVKAFPTNASTHLTLEFTLANTEKVTAQLFDLNGKLVKTILMNNEISSGIHLQPIDVADLNQGNYIIHLNAGKNSETIRFNKI